MICLATQVAVTYHVRETASVYAAGADIVRIEALEEEIVFLAAHLHAGDHRFLTLVAEYDRLRGWELGGHRSCAHWLAFRTGFDLGACRERVRAARALAKLPEISASMSRGELSSSKVRALNSIRSGSSQLAHGCCATTCSTRRATAPTSACMSVTSRC